MCKHLEQLLTLLKLDLQNETTPYYKEEKIASVITGYPA